MATKKAAKAKRRHVVLVAKPAGSNWARVLHGMLESYDAAAGTAVLTGARQALFYGRESGGELGLAATGPSSDSRLGPRVPGATHIAGVVLVVDATEQATTAWSRP